MHDFIIAFHDLKAGIVYENAQCLIYAEHFSRHRRSIMKHRMNMCKKRVIRQAPETQRELGHPTEANTVLREEKHVENNSENALSFIQ